jgi:hypothetical protein
MINEKNKLIFIIIIYLFLSLFISKHATDFCT